MEHPGNCDFSANCYLTIEKGNKIVYIKVA